MDQIDTGIQSVIKALTDTIAPAIDPCDPLAKEQAKLAVSYLEFVRKRLNFLHARERYDMLHYIGLAKELLDAGFADGWEGKAELQSNLATAEGLAANPAAITGTIRQATMELAHSTTALVQASAGFPAAQRNRVRRMVIDHTEKKMEFERLWLAPLGFDPTPPVEASLESHFKKALARPFPESSSRYR